MPKCRRPPQPLRASMLPAASFTRRILGFVLDIVCLGGIGMGIYIVAITTLNFGTVRSSLFCQALSFGILLHIFFLQPILAVLISCAHYLDFLIKRRGEPSHQQSSRDETLLKFLLANNYENGHSLEKSIESRSRSRYLRFAHPPTPTPDTVRRQQNKRTSFLFTRRLFLSLLLPALFLPMVWHEDVSTRSQLIQFQRTQLLGVEGNELKHFSDMKQHWLTRNWSSLFTCDHEKCFLSKSQAVIIGPIQLLSWSRRQKVCPDWLTHYPRLRGLSCRPQVRDGRRFSSTNPILENPRLQNHSEIHKLYKQILIADFAGRLQSHNLEEVSHIVWVESTSETKLVDSIKQFVTRLSNSSKAFALSATVYYPPADLVSSLRLLVENPTSGPPATTADVKVCRLDRYSTGTMVHLLFTADILILFFILAWSHIVISKLTKGYRSFDIAMQSAACVCGVTYIILFLIRSFLQQPLLDILRLTYREVFVDTHFLSLWDQMIISAAGATIFFSILSSLRLFKFFSLTEQFHKAFENAKRDLFLCSMIFGIIIIAFVHFANSLLCGYSIYTSQPGPMILGVLSVFTRSPVYTTHEDLPTVEYWGWRFLIFTGVLFSCGLLKAYILAVLCYHLRDVLRSRPSVQKSSTELLPPSSFIKIAAKSIAHLIARQQRFVSNGNQDELPTEFILAEVEYQVDEMLFKMHALAANDEISQQGRPTGHPINRPINSQSGGANDVLDFGLILPALDLRFLPEEGDEKQFRSQLELEIFRQLQVVRDQISSQGSGSDVSRLLFHQRESPHPLKRTSQLQNRIPGTRNTSLSYAEENLIPVTCLDGEEDGEWVEMEDLTEHRQLNPPCMSPPRQSFW